MFLGTETPAPVNTPAIATSAIVTPRPSVTLERSVMPRPAQDAGLDKTPPDQASTERAPGVVPTAPYRRLKHSTRVAPEASGFHRQRQLDEVVRQVSDQNHIVVFFSIDEAIGQRGPDVEARYVVCAQT